MMRWAFSRSPVVGICIGIFYSLDCPYSFISLACFGSGVMDVVIHYIVCAFLPRNTTAWIWQSARLGFRKFRLNFPDLGLQRLAPLSDASFYPFRLLPSFCIHRPVVSEGNIFRIKLKALRYLIPGLFHVGKPIYGVGVQLACLLHAVPFTSECLHLPLPLSLFFLMHFLQSFHPGEECHVRGRSRLGGGCPWRLRPFGSLCLRLCLCGHKAPCFEITKNPLRIPAKRASTQGHIWLCLPQKYTTLKRLSSGQGRRYGIISALDGIMRC